MVLLIANVGGQCRRIVLKGLLLYWLTINRILDVKLEAGGKPSTRFPPERLVELPLSKRVKIIVFCDALHEKTKKTKIVKISYFQGFMKNSPLHSTSLSSSKSREDNLPKQDLQRTSWGKCSELLLSRTNSLL